MKGKEYVRPVGSNWWLAKRSYTLFMLRESTALFVAGYSIFLIVLVAQATKTPDAFSAFADGLKGPVSLVLHVLVILMASYHSITWIQSMPKVMVFWRGDQRVGPGTIMGVGYLVWLVVSIVVAALAMAGTR